jgi:hypothetical protein
VNVTSAISATGLPCANTNTVSRTRTRPATAQQPGCPVRPPARDRSRPSTSGFAMWSTGRTLPDAALGRNAAPTYYQRGHRGSEELAAVAGISFAP